MFTMLPAKYRCVLVFFTSFWFYATLSHGSGFKHSTILDPHGKYHLKWRFDQRSITFEIEVETKGYIGFGLSPNGAMALSDIVIGGVMDDTPYLQDYFTDANREVHRDLQQNYRLEYGKENSTHTVLAFSRDLLTCDTSDKDITGSTVRVIWAYHSEDVGSSGPKYHGVNRGRKSMRLLDPGSKANIPSGTVSFNLQNMNVPVPFKDTTYWCQIFKIQEVQQKHHIVRGFTYPPHVGLSIGTSIDPVYVLMEVHYDNPDLQQGVVDSSGLRLFYTPELRQYDAGVIETGVWVSLYHMLPPGMPEFVSEGHCTHECLQESLGQEMPSGVRVFAILMHAHLAGRAIRTRHFRDQEELQPLSHDEEFDFNFQEFQLLKDERLLLPGDNLITECKYTTKGRQNMTWGGLSTRDEMCLSYLLYYPRVNLARCESLPEIHEQLKFIGVKEIQVPVTTWPFLIKSPKKYSNLSFTEAMDKYRWSKKRGRSFNEMVLQLPMNVRCSKWGQDEWGTQGMIVSPREVKSEVKPPSMMCPSASDPNSGVVLLLFTMCLTYAIVQSCSGL
ncbi:DBH-like monooxygenase protein 1 homolog isoform X2 [Esox lucius]|uniref:DBH-like monooxygenase protein 1 homolog isoform X2 n=1 Tax=Esox lucius TaxID=8010 RepID=UPI001477528E|nr:DBH-like monooxygenase protein 1 homolog isoform X2 [Esox lucius]